MKISNEETDSIGHNIMYRDGSIDTIKAMNDSAAYILAVKTFNAKLRADSINNKVTHVHILTVEDLSGTAIQFKLPKKFLDRIHVGR